MSGEVPSPVALPLGGHRPLFDGPSCYDSRPLGAGAGASLKRRCLEPGSLRYLLGHGCGAGGRGVGVRGGAGAHLLLCLEVPGSLLLEARACKESPLCGGGGWSAGGVWRLLSSPGGLRSHLLGAGPLGCADLQDDLSVATPHARLAERAVA